MALADRISALIGPTLESMGYELVRVQLTGGHKHQTLQIMAERSDGKAISVDDCETISHTISAQLDVADPIASAYTLEVSSPGIDRPLTRLKDFNRFAGFEARVQLRTPMNGQRNFRGVLKGVAGEDVALELPAEKKGMEARTVALPFTAIDSARLVLTEALIRAGVSN